MQRQIPIYVEGIEVGHIQTDDENNNMGFSSNNILESGPLLDKLTVIAASRTISEETTISFTASDLGSTKKYFESLKNN